MKKNIAEKWVKALRSKRYKQGRGALKYKTGKSIRHCCLGVLCELYQKEHKRKLPTVIDKDLFNLDIPKRSKVTTFDSEYGDLPEKARRWAGMKSEDGYIKSTGECLTAINDDGSNFNKIAEIIEKNMKEL